MRAEPLLPMDSEDAEPSGELFLVAFPSQVRERLEVLARERQVSVASLLAKVMDRILQGDI